MDVCRDVKVTVAGKPSREARVTMAGMPGRDARIVSRDAYNARKRWGEAGRL